MVAVKKFLNPLSHVVYAKRTLREIRFLRHLRHENIIELESIYVSGASNNSAIVVVLMVEHVLVVNT